MSITRVIDNHSQLSGLSNDDHTQYALTGIQGGGFTDVLYQAPWVGASSLSTSAVNVGSIHYQPFRVEGRVSNLIGMQFRVTSLPTNPTKILIAITSMGKNYQPISFVDKYTEITLSSASSIEITNLNTTLPEGMYQVAYQVDASISLQCIRGGLYNTFATSGFSTLVRAFRKTGTTYSPWASTPTHWNNVDTSTIGFENPFLLRFS
jgi:hypothetical protein